MKQVNAPAANRAATGMRVIISTHFCQKDRRGSRAVGGAIRMNDKKRKMPIPQRREAIKPEIRSIKTPAARMALMYGGCDREKTRRVSAARSALACRSIR